MVMLKTAYKIDITLLLFSNDTRFFNYDIAIKSSSFSTILLWITVFLEELFFKIT